MSLSMWNIVLAVGSVGAELQPGDDALARLEDPSHVVRLHAAAELGEEGRADKESIRALAKALDDPNEIVRFYAADSLGRFGKAVGIVRKDLLNAFGDESWIVRRKVAIALGAIGVAEDDFFRRLKQLYPDEAPAPHPQLVLLYLAHDPPRIKRKYDPDDLEDKAWDVRLRALRFFWEQREREQAATILGMLKDDNIAVRGMAIHLFETGDADAQRALYFEAAYLSHPNWLTAGHVSAVRAEDIYSPIAVKRMYGHSYDRVQQSLLSLIQRQQWNDDATIDFLRRMATSENANVRRPALRLLDQRMVTMD